jgi:hypothetical protein
MKTAHCTGQRYRRFVTQVRRLTIVGDDVSQCGDELRVSAIIERFQSLGDTTHCHSIHLAIAGQCPQGLGELGARTCAETDKCLRQRRKPIGRNGLSSKKGEYAVQSWTMKTATQPNQSASGIAPTLPTFRSIVGDCGEGPGQDGKIVRIAAA